MPPSDDDAPAEEKQPSGADRLSYLGRAGALASGFILVALGAIDAVFDPFPGPETALLTAGIALIVVGITGRRPERKG
jgi:hypothetical protein